MFRIARWSSFHDVAKLEVYIEWMRRLKGMDFTVFRVEGDGKVERYYVPLISSNGIPEGYPRDRAYKLNSRYFLEAEYFKEYTWIIFQCELDCDELIVKGKLDLNDEFKVKPLNVSTTNCLCYIGSDTVSYVLKSYRKIPRVNIEAKMLWKLTRRGFRNIPRLYLQLIHRKYGPLSIYLEYVDSLGDGGYPFAGNFINYLEGREPVDVKLARELGKTTAYLHLNLVDHYDDFFKPESISSLDVGLWIKRIKGIYLKFRETIPCSGDRLHSILDLFELYLDRIKARTHQDYHLAQMLYARDGRFVILDFEGEPNRSDEERLLKEPFLRDIACLLRSFDYLIAFTLAFKNGISLRDACNILLNKEKRIFNWYREVSLNLLESYIKTLGPKTEEATGFDRGTLEDEIVQLLAPWMLEKAIYELKYEHDYRPENIIVPLTGIKMLLEGTHPIYSL